MDALVTFELHFEHFIYTYNDNKITYPMYLILYQNSSKINKNHLNNVLIVTIGIII
jgi:hypothetical protein